MYALASSPGFGNPAMRHACRMTFWQKISVKLSAFVFASSYY
jgi:hypothetical protein